MDRLSVCWLGGLAVLLLSGCAVEAPPDDGVSWTLEVGENVDMSPQGRPEWAPGAETWEDDAEADSNEGSDKGSVETADPIDPLTPGSETSDGRADAVKPSDGLSAEANVGRFDPQPEPRISVKR